MRWHIQLRQCYLCRTWRTWLRPRVHSTVTMRVFWFKSMRSRRRPFEKKCHFGASIFIGDIPRRRVQWDVLTFGCKISIWVLEIGLFLSSLLIWMGQNLAVVTPNFPADVWLCGIQHPIQPLLDTSLRHHAASELVKFEWQLRVRPQVCQVSLSHWHNVVVTCHTILIISIFLAKIVRSSRLWYERWRQWLQWFSLILISIPTSFWHLGTFCFRWDHMRWCVQVLMHTNDHSQTTSRCFLGCYIPLEKWWISNEALAGPQKVGPKRPYYCYFYQNCQKFPENRNMPPPNPSYIQISD